MGKRALLFIFLVVICLGCSERFSHTVQQVPPPAQISTTIPDYSDSTIRIAAGAHYGRSRLHRFFYGEHYRKAWTTPVEVRVLDIGKEKGGLTPTQQGGSRQTLNLRLEDKKGREYVLRSVDKEPASVMPQWMQKSYIANIARDATSATHPYASLTVPAMADAIGIYSVEPELVYIPHDPRLGKYMDTFGGVMAMLERRPDGEQTDVARFGYAQDVKSTKSMLEHRLLSNNSKVDARFFLRSRLFDMLLGDWSRHEGNWRWAEFEGDSTTVYRAVPRDRDNIYYRLNDAIIPWLFMRTKLKEQFQTFRSEIHNVESLNKSGRNLDELLLAELTLQDWEEIADSIRSELTDQIIESSLRALPDTIYKLTARPIINRLESRRDDLRATARKYYKALAREVNIVGTDKQESFLVEVLPEERVRVQVYELSKKGDRQQLLYDRTFLESETKKLDLYGLDGDDVLHVNGNRKPKIKISLYGGAGDDSYAVHAQESRLGKSIYIEDSSYRNTYQLDKYTSTKANDKPAATIFDGTGWLLRYYLD